MCWFIGLNINKHFAVLLSSEKKKEASKQRFQLSRRK